LDLFFNLLSGFFSFTGIYEVNFYKLSIASSVSLPVVDDDLVTFLFTFYGGGGGGFLDFTGVGGNSYFF
jgi:hypothetical protein